VVIKVDYITLAFIFTRK